MMPAARWIAALAAGGFVLSGLVPSGYVVARMPALLGTAYGLLVAVRVLLTLLPIWLWWRRGVGRTWLLAATIAVSMLVQLPAAADLGQPTWPIPWTLSLDVVRTDAVLRIEMLRAVPWLAASALLLLAATLLWRRLGLTRWLVVMVAIVTIWLTTPDLTPLVVPAYPTTYYRSPTRLAAASILRGEAVYRAHCVGCHGVAGRGDGIVAAGLARAPADLTAGHLWMHSDGELFWWLWHGIDGPQGVRAMPGFADTLSAEGIWNVIDYVRVRNAGSQQQRTGQWSPTLLAPDLPIACADGRQSSLAELRGRPVRLVIGDAPMPVEAAMAVVVTDDPAISPAAGRCVAGGAAARAYALAAGVAEQEADGMQFLVDQNGWLRAMQKPAPQDGWNNPAQLAAALWLLATVPVVGDRSLCHAQK